MIALSSKLSAVLVTKFSTPPPIGTMVLPKAQFFVASENDWCSERDGRILKGVFHANGGAWNANLDNKDTSCLDLGPEDPKENENALMAKIKETRDQGLSATGCKDVKTLFREFGDAVELNLDAGQLAKIGPLRIELKPDAVLVRAMRQYYPQLRREFRSEYICELLKFGLVKKVLSFEWVSALLLVLK